MFASFVTIGTLAAALLTFAAGWVTNVLWTFDQTTGGNIALGIVGIFVPFIGALHGIWTWF